MQPESYKGKSTPIGNSNGFRFDAALFKAHPEFFGEVKATVFAAGQMLVSIVPSGQQHDVDEVNDPVMQVFISFLEKQMLEHPESIEPIDEAQMQRIAALVEGVEVD